MPRSPGTYPSPHWYNNRAVAFQRYAPAALTGNVALVYAPPGANEVQVRGRYLALSPGASNRNVKMPPEADSSGVALTITNSVALGQGALILQSSAGNVLNVVVLGGQSATLLCDGTSWFLPDLDRGPLARLQTEVLYSEDFLGIPTQALPIGLTTQDTSPAGAPTLDYVVDQVGGIYRLGLAATNEAEAITLYAGDHQTINGAKGFYFECRFAFTPDVTGGAATPAAGDKCVVGVGGDRNATLDNMTLNAWFLIGGAADMVLRVEADDNTTDVDDTTTGVTLAAGTFVTVAIDMLTPSEGPKFYVNSTLKNTLGTVGAWAATKLQPFVENAKAAAPNKDHRLDIDYLYLRGYR